MPGYGLGIYGYGLYGIGAGVDYPYFLDEVAFASLPFDTPQIYSDLTARTRLRSWSRGRRSERDRPDRGTSTTVFENMDRALDSVYAGSPYFPNVVPMRRIRSRAIFDGVSYPLFTNFVAPEYGWQLDQSTTGYSEATAVAYDGFDVLSTAQFTSLDSFPSQSVSDRITAILDLFSWPAADRDIDTADTALVQSAAVGSLAGQSALDQIQAASDTENGVFFIDGRGFATFHSRYYPLLNARALTSQATFCDKANFAPGYYLYKSLTPSSSPVVNDYLVTRNGGTQVEALDSVSIGNYRRRSQTLTTLHVTDSDALDYGRYKVVATRDPQRRYDEMTLTPAGDAAMWLLLLQLQIGDRITVMSSPPGGGSADVREMFVEAVKFDMGPGVNSSVTLRLSPGNSTTGWILGDATHGVLGSTTILVY